jgi:arginine/lysine/ornithine decarboxylase
MLASMCVHACRPRVAPRDVQALLTAEDAVISDQLNHASIIDGIRLCKAQRLRHAPLQRPSGYCVMTNKEQQDASAMAACLCVC